MHGSGLRESPVSQMCCYSCWSYLLAFNKNRALGGFLDFRKFRFAVLQGSIPGVKGL